MMITVILFISSVCGVLASIIFLIQDYRAKGIIRKHEEDISRRMYELAILKEIGERAGYSLDVQQVIDIITSSLHQFIEYSMVSYMLVEPDSIVFKVHLENSVNRGFVVRVRDYMLSSLEELLHRDIKQSEIREITSGAILAEDLDLQVNSVFNIPLVINEKTVGILTVADTKPGLYKGEEMAILHKLVQQASQAVSRLKEVVRTEQEKVNALVQSMEDGVVMTDADYRILVVNPAAKRIIGQENKDTITIFDFIDNLGGKLDIRGRLEESVKLKKTYVSDRFNLHDKYYQSFVFPVRTSAPHVHEVLGGVVIFHDVTREVELERVREDFTSMIVHELRTPLSGIQKASELLKKPPKKSVESKKFLDIIYQNSSSMLDLVNDILDASKLRAGKFEITLEPADIAAVIRDRIDFFNLSALDRHMKLSIYVSETMVKTISFDVQRIKQVINNLLSNALKYTAEGGSVSLITFEHVPGIAVNEEIKQAHLALPDALPEAQFAELPRSVVVVVTDTGIGIDDSSIPRLFNKFRQLDNNALMPNIKGTGLGLAIVKGIIEGHGGIIGVVSKVGGGSAFYFTLPATVTGHTIS